MAAYGIKKTFFLIKVNKRSKKTVNPTALKRMYKLDKNGCGPLNHFLG